MNGDETDERLAAFVRGELEPDEAVKFELVLARRPDLRLRVARASAPTVTGRATFEQSHTDGRALSGEAEDRHLQLGVILGRGGMAVVYEGTQTHLGRQVAVKTVRPGLESWAQEKLLQEARITGFLEHPGIVPVHDLIEAEAGQLQVVLKRIDGVSWLKLMGLPHEVRARFESDPLEWNVAVLISVCRAVQFAHERGVIHRDIKPANVMIGRFGEVTLLDWGVAGTMQRDPTGMLPWLDDFPLAGTLNFMAPEQLHEVVSAQGPVTDTFLLGGCLFQALFGTAPFPQTTLAERMLSAQQAPLFPQSVETPAELVTIARRALDPASANRYQSADALRKALEGFLRHRDARRLTDNALLKAAEARAGWATGAHDAAEQAAADAEFGFRAALELWPDDETAREQRSMLAAERVRFAAQQGEVRAASFLLKSVDRPSPTLVHEIGQAVEAELDEHSRLKRIAHDVDRRFGVRVRRWMLALFGLTWLVFWSSVALWPPSSTRPLLTFLSLYTTVGVVLTLSLGKALLEHRLSREMMLVQLAMLLVSMTLIALAGPLALTVPRLLPLLMLVWSLGMAAVAAMVEPASLVPSVAWLVGSLIGALVPAWLPAALITCSIVHFVGPLLVNLRVKKLEPGLKSSRFR